MARDNNRRILVVDDDTGTCRMIARYFEQHNLTVSRATGWHEVKCHLAATRPKLIILASREGWDHGLDLLKQIRTISSIPVIFTSGRLDEIDRVVALELGADDYVLEPFGVRELLARVRAVLRRHEPARTLAHRRDSQDVCHKFNGWRFERHSRRLTAPDGSAAPLTRTEAELLGAFLDRPQTYLTREYLLRATRIREDIRGRSVDVQVLRLRRKLETYLNVPSIIRTERGVGYMFSLTVERL